MGAQAGIGMGLYQTIKGGKEKRDAANALENYERQEFKNAYDDVAVSTLGADRQLENQARLASSQIAALKDSGTRGLIGGLGRVEVGNQNVNQQIAADLDQQQKAIDYAAANDRAIIRGMTENRENADIAALSSQYQAGRQDQNTGMGNMLTGVGMLENQIKGAALSMTGMPSGGGGGQFSVSGSAQGPNTPMTSPSMRFAPQSGYATPPILTNPSYNPQNFGPQNAYGIFNQRYPYGNVYGPQQR